MHLYTAHEQMPTNSYLKCMTRSLSCNFDKKNQRKTFSKQLQTSIDMNDITLVNTAQHFPHLNAYAKGKHSLQCLSDVKLIVNACT